MTGYAERCPRCPQPLPPGAAFCTSYRTPLSNHSARNTRDVRELAGIPGSIPVTQGPRRGPRTRGGKTMPNKLKLVPASTGQRLEAAVRDPTNGSSVTTPDGLRTALTAGESTHVRPGSTVHFGDRSFYLGQA